MTTIERFHSAVAEVARYFLIVREFMLSTFHPVMPVFYVLSIIISGVLLWFTIYCISASGWIKSKVIEKAMDMHGIGDVGKYRQLKAWKHIVKRMNTPNPANWKLSILEADALMDEVFKASGYRGPNADERFKQITPEEMPNIEELRGAHQIRNRVMREPDFALDKAEALRVIRIYQAAFREDGLLD